MCQRLRDRKKRWRLRSRSLRITSRSSRAQKYRVACPRGRRDFGIDAPCRLQALALAPGEHALRRKAGRRRFPATRCDPGLSRFGKRWTRTRPGSVRCCRGTTRIGFRCADVAAGGPVVTRDAREPVRGARARRRDASLGPKIDAIASLAHAITSSGARNRSSGPPSRRLSARPPVPLTVPWSGHHLDTFGHGRGRS